MANTKDNQIAQGKVIIRKWLDSIGIDQYGDDGCEICHLIDESRAFVGLPDIKVARKMLLPKDN